MIGLTRNGPAGAQALVFLHGGVINRQMWLPVTSRLDSEFDCLAIDLPAHGELSHRDFTVASSVETVTRTLDSLGITRAVLIGLSLGGYIAQAVASRQPERVAGLVLAGATVRYTGRDGWSTRMYGMVFPLVARPAAKTFAKKLREDLGDAVADPILAAGLSMRGGGQALRRLPGRDYGDEMGRRFAGPIVIANGERDRPNREAESLFLQDHPQAESVVIENAGHACALQQPIAFAAAVTRAVRDSTSQ